MSPFVSYTTPEPDPELVEICTTDGSTRATTCSYCCSKEEAPPAGAAAGDGLAVGAPVPPAPVQDAAVKTAMTVPAPASHRPVAALRDPAWATRPLLIPPGTWLL